MGTEALQLLAGLDLKVLVCGQRYGNDITSVSLVSKVLESYPRTAIIFVATNGSEELAIRTFRAGATDYIRQSLDLEELVATVTRIGAKIQHINESPSLSPPQDSDFACIEKALERPFIGDSAVMRQVKSRLICAAAAPDSNVLITGETGTGKELAAQFIHKASLRKSKPLISVNCAAMPESLLESQLFGHERGSFTGAQWTTAGLLERTEGGTLFLDEVDELSSIAQAKILRVIESKELSRVGGKDTLRVNVRFVAATNQDVETLVKDRRFRNDLYFRLNVVRIRLPALRERKSDLPALITYYLDEFNRQFRRHVQGLSDSSYRWLLEYDWPGNVRELRNVLEATFVNLPPEHAALIDLLPEIGLHGTATHANGLPEQDRLLSVLLSTKWNKSEAARQLSWSRMTLYRKMKRYKLIHVREPFLSHGSRA
jgi:DNA-binding NtrC family response regulator